MILENLKNLFKIFKKSRINPKSNNMTLESFKALPDIVRFMEEPDCHWQQSIKPNTPQFKSDIVLEYTYYPSSFESDNPEEDKASLKKIKAKNIFEPYEKTFLEPFNIGFLSDEDKKNDGEYNLILMYFGVPSFGEFKKYFKTLGLMFYLIPSYYEDGTMNVAVFYNLNPCLPPFETVVEAKVLDVNTQNEYEKYYLKAFTEAVEIVCNEFEIVTEKNQGKFVKSVEEAPEKLLEEFIEIVGVKGFRSEEEIQVFKQNWHLIQENPEKYKEILVDEGYFDEDSEVDIPYFTQHLLSELLLTFNSDWKVDYDDLSQFISEEIQQEFTIKDKEMWQIAEKIEKESDFTMLNIDTQMDSYSLFICEKSEKERILEIARKLDFPIEAHF
ncbi:hypothetical protein J5295_03795 [Riemerella anatipestifer]|uniref:DUF6630 family protein n=2 Tax=Riemerella anatipestifer TaxID=34085 RepID=UPI0001F0E4B8|nr:hypothetical protein [Riemerella anatipestifer]ADZ12049.1 hypothetical protein RIA_0916 [Riemerella anatipestifer RA-GD]AGC39608.1 hypothetical protein G148_0303 [Riemerella anatipestifer RA-CH-2]AKP69653.1 hypothetical protein CG08_1447 [Riemerella anatipestifer]AKP71562.1 hypothetical protein CG09_1387 [Riemerella anatipestifer]EFT36860.1 hypothetical protein RAYM_00550 [Riemerella anatipestifer RA-YM]